MLNHKNKIFVSVIALSLVLVASVNLGRFALAQDGESTQGVVTTLQNPLTTANPSILIGNAIKTILSGFGATALLMFVIGGIIWMTSMGDPEKVKKGRDTLLWAALGIVAIFSSYAILKLVFEIVMAK